MLDTVVHYVDAQTYGGVEQVVRLLLSRVDRQRWNPLLYVHEHPGITRLVDEARALDIPTRFVPAPLGLADVRAWSRFRAQLRADRPAVFHAHLNWPLGCRHGLLAARLARLPYVAATAHLFYQIDGASWARAKHWLQQATIDRYIAVSADVGQRLQQDLRVRAEKIAVVHNGIEVSDEPPLPDLALRAELLQGDNRPVALTVARLHAQKGIDHLLDAAAALPGIRFAIAGDGPERERLERRTCELGLAGRMQFLGHRRDVPALLAASDLFVLPSLYEGLPLSVLEAMAAAKPVVATDVGGTRDAVGDGRTGWLVPAGDAGALATAIGAAMADRPAATAVGVAARERVRQHFSAQAMTRSVERIYEHDLARRARVQQENTV